MSAMHTISEALDTINAAIGFNYIFLPVISALVYVAWALLARRAVKSAWYISLGIPGAIALVLSLAEDLIFHPGIMIIGDRVKLALMTLIYMPGYIVPTIVMVYHIVKFSSTEPMTKSAYFLAIPIVLTYAANWLTAWYLADW